MILIPFLHSSAKPATWQHLASLQNLQQNLQHGNILRDSKTRNLATSCESTKLATWLHLASSQNSQIAYILRVSKTRNMATSWSTAKLATLWCPWWEMKNTLNMAMFWSIWNHTECSLETLRSCWLNEDASCWGSNIQIECTTFKHTNCFSDCFFFLNCLFLLNVAIQKWCIVHEISCCVHRW